ncbi:MAG: hypothetical protein UEP78_07270 [Negativibacillus sp.]|nr:hypothetical protein [Negativibacillus sp.]
MVSLPILLFFRFPNGSFCRCQLFFQQMQKFRAASDSFGMLISTVTAGLRRSIAKSASCLVIRLQEQTYFFFFLSLPEKRAGKNYLPFFGCQN